MTTVIVVAGSAGSRVVVTTSDSAARQSTPTPIVLALSGDRLQAIERSLGARLGAVGVRGESEPAAVNAAVRAAAGEEFLFVRAPWCLDASGVESAVAGLNHDPCVSAMLPELRLRTNEGRTLQSTSVQMSLSTLLSDPLAPPPVFAIRRTAWERLGPLDPSAGDLAWCEWWLRFLAEGLAVAGGGALVATLAVGSDNWWPTPGRTVDATAYRNVLERHSELLQRQLTALVVHQELAFGELLTRHREAVRARDRLLGELDGLRATTAHHRAYIEHHARGAVDLGDLRRPDPISRDWGYDRGTPVDRRYIEDFLAAHSSDVSGAVLEVQEDDFTRQFGGPRVADSQVVDLDDANPRATVVADLRAAPELPDSRFGCVILTQTLHVISDMQAVIRECSRILEPGGVLLATIPAASRVCLEYGEGGDLWRMTPAGARALFEPVFGPRNVEETAYGSVLTNVAFLHGLAASELTDEEFEAHDPYHPLVTGVRATKRPSILDSSRAGCGAVLLYHRFDDRPDVHDLSIPPALFEEQLEWLSRECEVVPLDRMLSNAKRGLPERAVAITFDDGYLDVLQCGAPMLERRGMPATVFATTRWLQEPGEYWWDVLERVFMESETPPELTIEIGADRVRFSTDTISARRATHDAVHGKLVHASLAQRERIVERIVSWAGYVPDHRRRPLTADEIQSLARVPGIAIGAHTVNHLALPDQPADVRTTEILGSTAALASLVSGGGATFAYPYGAVDRATAGVARASCRWSLTCDARPIGRSFDAGRVPRLEVKRWGAAALQAQLEAVWARL